LRALVHWSLLSSEAVRQILDDAYKIPPQSRIERHDLDTTSNLGITPLTTIRGTTYQLIEGRDTRFRIYASTNPHHKIVNISSLAHDKPSLLVLADTLDAEGKMEKDLATIIRDTVLARIEAAEGRRVKAEQAAMRLAMWQSSAPVYNTRTRGKRVDYSEFGKDSGDDEDDQTGRRSERGKEAQVVEYTASGRMVKRPRVEGQEGRELRETRMKSASDSEEEMEWSVYSDKGEVELESDGEEGEEEEFDVGGRSVVVIFKIDKDRLRGVLNMQDCISVNGTVMPGTTVAPMAEYQRPPQESPKQQFSPKQSQPSPYQQSPPRAYPAIPPYRSPVLSGPLPYATGPSPPVPKKPAQLLPQPNPRLTLSYQQSPPQPYQPPQAYQQAPQPQAYQQASRPQVPQPAPQSYQAQPRHTPYPVAQFSPRPSPPEVNSRPYSANGAAHTAPPNLAPRVPEWSGPRPFGSSPSPYGIPAKNITPPQALAGPLPYGAPKSVTPPQPPIPTQISSIPTQLSPRPAHISPRQQTWAAAKFEPPVNGVPLQPEHPGKMPHAILETSTGSNVVNGDTEGVNGGHFNVNGKRMGDGV
jgi:hypothetical protein